MNPEQLAYWYFRLNGFLTTVNFVIHPEQGAEQRTDVDILGVRFPYRAELLTDPMEDEPLFRQEARRPYVVFAEVKKDRCKLNGPWTRKDDQNMHRALTAVGAIRPEHIGAAAEDLYTEGVYENGDVYLTLCCIGRRTSPAISRKFLKVPQLLWPAVAAFIHHRFQAYFSQKLSHPQWDETGQKLWKLFEGNQSAKHFAHKIDAALNAGQEL